MPTIRFRWRIVLMGLCGFYVMRQLVLFNVHSKMNGLDNDRPNGRAMRADTLPVSFANFKYNFHEATMSKNPLHGNVFRSRLKAMQYDFDTLGSPSPRATAIQQRRQDAVKKSFLHAWQGYIKHALGHDEIQPITKTPKDPFGGWGATLVDGLSTLLVMELHDEFKQALPELEKINFKIDQKISVFETIIRYLGGLLSAYELSEKKYAILLLKAEELGKMLLPSFETPVGFPPHEWNPLRQEGSSRYTLFAEVASLQLEFMTLSQHTGNTTYGEKAQDIINYLDTMGYEHGLYIKGLFPTHLDIKKGRFTDAMCNFGGRGDSAFEYFLKAYILTDGINPQYGRLYTDAIDNMKFHMLHQFPGTPLLFLPSYNTKKRLAGKSMDHLTCFVPGMLAMGSKIFDRPDDMVVAKGLLETCIYMYRSSATGLGPEIWSFTNAVPYNPITYRISLRDLREAHKWWSNGESAASNTGYGYAAWSAKGTGRKEQSMTGTVNISSTLPLPPLPRPRGLYPLNKKYLLRPETLESIFILYRITGDPVYQEYGWEIYEAIEKWCKTDVAFASINNVDIAQRKGNQINSMESFALAETFKYLYLLFSPPDVISLDRFVFNTEAHPFLRWPMDLSR